mgnify:CR=1 FL=1
MPAVAGLTAVGTLMDEDEDAEEKRRRMEAKIAAENFGAAIGFAAGAVHDDLVDLRDLHYALILELLHQSRRNFRSILCFHIRNHLLQPPLLKAFRRSACTPPA